MLFVLPCLNCDIFKVQEVRESINLMTEILHDISVTFKY